MSCFYLFNETDVDLKQEEETLRKLLSFALEKEQLKDVEFNIIFIDNERIQEINRVYRGIDRPTDVISFALEDYKEEGIVHRMLGDIYISVEKAKGQAEEYGHSFLREICFLAVHGFYHLLGYDHMVPEEEKVMFQKQEELLDAFEIRREVE